eukprot:6484763-Amphidinium_carterae.1
MKLPALQLLADYTRARESNQGQNRVANKAFNIITDFFFPNHSLCIQHDITNARPMLERMQIFPETSEHDYSRL